MKLVRKRSNHFDSEKAAVVRKEWPEREAKQD
jgi:hypothetical protein